MVEAIAGGKAGKNSLYAQTSPDGVATAVLNSAKSNSNVAKGIGAAYDKAYKEYMDALSPSGKEELSQAEITQKQLQYQHVVLVFQGFLQMASNTFQIMMNAIRQLGVR